MQNNVARTQRLNRIITATKWIHIAVIITTNADIDTLNSAKIDVLVFPEIPFPLIARVPARQLAQKS